MSTFYDDPPSQLWKFTTFFFEWILPLPYICVLSTIWSCNCCKQAGGILIKMSLDSSSNKFRNLSKLCVLQQTDLCFWILQNCTWSLIMMKNWLTDIFNVNLKKPLMPIGNWQLNLWAISTISNHAYLWLCLSAVMTVSNYAYQPSCSSAIRN